MSRNPYLKNRKKCIFDIETTGLMSFRDKIISASFCEDPDKAPLQLFSEGADDEAKVVARILEELAGYDCIVTYNGDSFDLPFVLARAKKYKLAERLPLFWSADLYRWLKRYWPMAERMPSLRQKSVEQALGLAPERTDEIGGGECIPLYNHYLLTRDPADRETILLHNADDVRQLARIEQAAGFLPFHRIAFELGFGCGRYVFDSLAVKGLRLAAEGRADLGDLPMAVFEDGYSLDYDAKSGRFSLAVELRKEADMEFADLRALPADESSFAELGGLHSGYLVLKEGGEVQMREACALADALLEKLSDAPQNAGGGQLSLF